MLSKKLEETFLPSIQQVREKRNLEVEIDTHRRYHEVLDRMYKRLSGQTSEEAQEEAKLLKIVLHEKDQQIDRLQRKLEEPVFKKADDNLETLRTNTCESLKHRNPIIKKELPGAWRIISTGERKLLATVGDGRVVLLQRWDSGLGDELKHEDVIHGTDWTPAGVALVDDSIFIGDVAGAVPCSRTTTNTKRKELMTATTDFPGRKGFSRLRKFSKQTSKQLQEIKGQFGDPSGMAFNRDKVLHVCDQSTNCIWMLELGANLQLDTSCHITGFYNENEGHFQRPVAIDFDGDGNMYVLDQGNRRVQVFNPKFQLQRTFGKEVLGCKSCGIHVTKQFVYVTQTMNNCVSVFDKQTGTFLISFSGIGLENPVGITVDSEGYIYVCDDNGVWVF